MSDLPQGDGGYIWATGDAVALSDSMLYAAAQASVGIGTNSPSQLLTLSDSAYNNTISTSTQLEANGINSGNDIFTISDSEGNAVLEISKGKVRIFGDLVVEGATEDRRSPEDFIDRSIDNVLRDLQSTVGGT